MCTGCVSGRGIACAGLPSQLRVPSVGRGIETSVARRISLIETTHSADQSPAVADGERAACGLRWTRHVCNGSWGGLAGEFSSEGGDIAHFVRSVDGLT